MGLWVLRDLQAPRKAGQSPLYKTNSKATEGRGKVTRPDRKALRRPGLGPRGATSLPAAGQQVRGQTSKQRDGEQSC